MYQQHNIQNYSDLGYIQQAQEIFLAIDIRLAEVKSTAKEQLEHLYLEVSHLSSDDWEEATHMIRNAKIIFMDSIMEIAHELEHTRKQLVYAADHIVPTEESDIMKNNIRERVLETKQQLANTIDKVNTAINTKQEEVFTKRDNELHKTRNQRHHELRIHSY